MSAPENSALIGYVAIESGQLLLVDLGMLADPRVVVSDNARVALSKRKRVTTERKCVATPIVDGAHLHWPAIPKKTVPMSAVVIDSMGGDGCFPIYLLHANVLLPELATGLFIDFTDRGITNDNAEWVRRLEPMLTPKPTP